MDKKKIDLSNPGGHPKDWLDRAKEPSDGWKVGLWAGAILLAICAGIVLVVSGLFF